MFSDFRPYKYHTDSEDGAEIEALKEKLRELFMDHSLCVIDTAFIRAVERTKRSLARNIKFRDLI